MRNTPPPTHNNLPLAKGDKRQTEMSEEEDSDTVEEIITVRPLPTPRLKQIQVHHAQRHVASPWCNGHADSGRLAAQVMATVLLLVIVSSLHHTCSYQIL